MRSRHWKLMILVVTGIVLAMAQVNATSASPQQDRDTAPPQRERMGDMQGMGMGGMMRMMQRCREHCAAASQTMDEMAKTLADAEQSGDPQRMRTALRQAQDHLARMKDRMSDCMAMMDRMHDRMNDAPGMMCPMCGQMMNRGGGGPGRSELSSLPDPAAQTIQDLLTAYFRAGDLLANDATRGLAEPAQKIAQAVDRAVAVEIPEASDFWRRHSKETSAIQSAARSLAQTTDLAQARQRYADLSGALRTLITATGVPPQMETEVTVLDCPMFPKGPPMGGAVWLQPGPPTGKVRNPYMGPRMLACFGERSTMPVTGAPAPSEEAGNRDKPDRPPR